LSIFAARQDIKNMKVLHLFYSGLGGHGNVFFSMVDADEDKTYQYEALFFGIEEVRPQYVQKAGERSIKWNFVKKKPGLDLGSYKAVARIIKTSAPEILFLHGGCYIFPAWFGALISPKKTKIIVRETVPNHLKTKLDWIGLAFSLVAAKKTAFLSVEYRDAIKKKLPLLFSDKRTTVIPNGIDLNVFKPAAKPVPGIVKIGMQSRLSGTKDHATLIKAFAILTKQVSYNIELIIAGDGECREQLEQLAKDIQVADKVKFTGMLEETALPGFINSLDIYVHATLGETMSTAIMQVMACKIPVIASDVLGVNNMIRHEINGLLVPARNEAALASSILLYLNNESIRSGYAENAYNFAVENYSNKTMFKKYQTVFNSN
jgi:glycosyltransferase involved in cell wall biosynthesis